MTYGDACIGEMKSYKFFLNEEEIKCDNQQDTCERALCECDKLMAEEHASTAESWDQQV